MRYGIEKTGLVIGAMVLAGCAPQGEQIMIQNARGAEYSRGYADGCASGRHVAGNMEVNATRDTLLFLNDSQYKSGWNQGFKECKFREKKIAKLPQESLPAVRL